VLSPEVCAAQTAQFELARAAGVPVVRLRPGHVDDRPCNKIFGSFPPHLVSADDPRYRLRPVALAAAP
jgi:hypothetical protein